MRLSALAEAVGGEFDPLYADLLIHRIASLDGADEQSVVFIMKESYIPAAEASKASAVFVKKGWNVVGKACVEVEDPYYAYALTAQIFEDRTPVFGTGVHPSAVVAPGVVLPQSVSLGPLCVIGEGVVIGENTTLDAGVIVERGSTIGTSCHLHSGVVICRETTLGDRVIILSGAVIGGEGFANAFHEGRFTRIPCFGRVCIGNDVEIGANTTIDRGNFEDTVIHDGVRLDNLIMVGHNVEIGESCAVASQAGFAGSTKLGKRVIVGGQVGFSGHNTIGDNVFIGAQAGVHGDIEAGERVTGTPCVKLMTRRRIDAAEQKLPEALRELNALRKEIEILKAGAGK